MKERIHSYFKEILFLLCFTISIFVFNKLFHVKAYFLSSSLFLDGFAIRKENVAKKKMNVT